ncbi:hypothetical protein FACS1894217_12710 [Clostridia bacterium]|nr:hypothetical protein FACS1894217_12710 [Clostridia bacterium]
MKWLHISDLHYDPKRDGIVSRDLRGALPQYLKDKIGAVDELFITGDYRHASNQKDDDQDAIARDVVNFIWDIAHSVGINDVSHIHIIPGNHDLTRFDDKLDKAETLKELQKSYDPNRGVIGTKELPVETLLSRFEFYKLVSKNLYGDDPEAAIWENDTLLPLHTYRCGNDYNIIYLNTAVTCNRNDERGQLVIGCNDLDLALKKTSANGKPIIILAHHTLDTFRADECKKIESWFSAYPQVALYLCGDAHKDWHRRINNVHEITMGCMTYEKDTEVVFSVGEIASGGQLRKFNAHRWVTSKFNNHGKWEAYKDFDENVLPSNRIVTLPKPERPAKEFLGRDKKIDEVWQALDADKTAVLNGIGGIGKTEICRSIFWECEKNGVHGIAQVGWLTFQGDLPSTFMGQFKDIADGTGNKEDYFSRVVQYLNDKGHSLLLFVDNANEISKEELRLLSELSCRVIVTARYKLDIRGDIQYVKVDELSLEDCRKLYRRHANPEDTHAAENAAPDKTIDAIIKLAGRHTLAVELLAKTRYESWQSDEDMLKELSERGFDLSEKWGKIERVDAEDRFIGHMSKIFDMAGIEGEELRVLRLFSLLAPDKIAYSHVEKWLDLPNPDAVNKLNKRGWLKREVDNAVSMHPIIAAVVRKEQPVEWDEGKPLVVQLRKALEMEITEIFTAKLPILPHAISVSKFFKDEEDKEIAHLLHNIACVFHDQGDYDKALELRYKALAISEKVFGAKHPNTATTYNNIANLYHYQGDYDKALEWHKKALGIREKVLGTEHPDTAMTYNNIACVYHDQGDYDQALEWYKKALAISEKVLGTEHPFTATTYNNIACVFQDQGDYDKALEWHYKALAIREKVSGTEHPDIATMYNNIACVFHDQGDCDKALELCKKALEIREKVLGTEHPDTATTYNNIACVFRDQGEYAKARDLFCRAYIVRVKRGLMENPNTKDTFESMCDSYLTAGGKDENFVAWLDERQSTYPEWCDKLLPTAPPT